MDPKQLIIKPVLSEKSLQAQKQNVYTFWVSLKATKNQIKQAVSQLFNVKVIKVNMAVKGPEIKKQQRKNKTYLAPKLKKAYVKIAPGQKITLLEGK
ncbi:MAG: 50S ribosomal protein L23 [bacterium]|nr:50S ribosomal protein L23 [bacterium]